MKTVTIEGVTIELAHPTTLDVHWVGQEELKLQLHAAWLVLGPKDHPRMQSVWRPRADPPEQP